MMVTLVSQGQEPYDGHTYQPLDSAGGYSSYHWRPMDGQDKHGYQPSHTFRGGAEYIPSQPDPVKGLPSGTYRPLDDKNRIAPQIGTYRFRSITPAEKSRLQKRKEMKMNPDDRLDSTQSKYKFRGFDTPYDGSPASGMQPVFRPDRRFSGQQSDYLYNRPDTYPSYASPIFRQDDRKK
jgi:hypothetical protein